MQDFKDDGFKLENGKQRRLRGSTRTKKKETRGITQLHAGGGDSDGGGYVRVSAKRD